MENAAARTVGRRIENIQVKKSELAAHNALGDLPVILCANDAGTLADGSDVAVVHGRDARVAGGPLYVLRGNSVLQLQRDINTPAPDGDIRLLQLQYGAGARGRVDDAVRGGAGGAAAFGGLCCFFCLQVDNRGVSMRWSPQVIVTTVSPAPTAVTRPNSSTVTTLSSPEE